VKTTLIICLLIAVAPSVAIPETFVIHPDGTGDYETIQAGIDAAVDGDIIELADGVFTGEGNCGISFRGKRIIVRSVSGNPESCTIAPHGCGGFYFGSSETADTRIEGITITDTGLEQAVVSHDADAHVHNCIFRDNYGSGVGGAVYCVRSSVRLTECEFRDNWTNFCGGAVYCLDSELRCEGCSFVQNMTVGEDPVGGAICCRNSIVELDDCLFEGNITTWSDEDSGAGGGIYAADCNVALTRCVFYGNDAHNSGTGGGISAWDCELFLSACTFVSNSTNGYMGWEWGPDAGGAIALSNSHAEILGCTMCRNSAGSGSGISLGGGSQVTIRHTIIASGYYGEAISGTFAGSITCCDFYENEGGDWVGDIADLLGVYGNITLDPLFCSPYCQDLSIDAASPCAPYSDPNPGCALIGAWPVGCSTPTERTSWGGLKFLFKK